MSDHHPMLMRVPIVGPLIDVQPLHDLITLAELHDTLTPEERRYAIHKARDTVKRLRATIQAAESRLKAFTEE